MNLVLSEFAPYLAPLIVWTGNHVERFKYPNEAIAPASILSLR